MKEVYKAMNNKKILFFFSVVYLLLAYYIFPHYRFFIQDDVASYIDIAKKYASGHFADAVNGYWSPLLPLLMVPLLFLGVYPLFAVKFISILSGLGVLVGMNMFANKFAFEPKIKFAVLASATPLLLYFSATDLSPDLLTACLLLLYLYCTLDDHYAARRSLGVYAGLLGGLAYLAKSYCFFFFIVHFIVVNISQYFSSEKKFQKSVVINFALGMLIFSVISATWIAFISTKYDHFTTSTVAEINFSSIIAPGRPSPGYPMKYEGLLPPPDQFSVSAWDDPSYFHVKKWSPLQSLHDFVYFGKHTFLNVLGAYVILAELSVIFPFLLVVLMLLMLSKLEYASREAFFRSAKKICCEPDLVVWLTIALLVYFGGYALALVQARYLWIIFLVLLLIGGELVQRFFTFYSFEERGKVVVLCCLWVVVVTIPLVNLEFGAGQGRDTYDLAIVLQNLGVSGNIASSPQQGTMQNYQKTLELSYLIHVTYFGEPLAHEGGALTQELKQKHIDYYLDWNKADVALPTSDFIEMSDPTHPELTIYRSTQTLHR